MLEERLEAQGVELGEGGDRLEALAGQVDAALAHEQLLERRVPPDAERQLDVDAELDDRFDLACDEGAGEAILGDRFEFISGR